MQEILSQLLRSFHIFPSCLPIQMNQDCSVGIATGYRLDDQGRVGVRVPVE
jgi:hypothetical protein